MQAQCLARPGAVPEAVESDSAGLAGPLTMVERPVPDPGPGELLIRVRACAVCHTDLHIVEGEIPLPRLPIIPGHQVVGVVEKDGGAAPGRSAASGAVPAGGIARGTRVGVAWLHRTCQACAACRAGTENLCDRAQFTGYHVDGGFAEFLTAPREFVYRLPDRFTDIEAAPLLCAGIIGYRALRLSEVRPGERLALFGFGASAHLTLQVAAHRGCEVHVYSRSEAHRRLALDLGAAWAGEAGETAPAPADRAILFAPAGRLIPDALRALRRGGTLAIAAIHLDRIPAMDYALLYGERTIRSVTASTRQDGDELLRSAAEAGLRVATEAFPLREAVRALALLKAGRIRGAGVLVMAE
jgi:propanol-preferring alcohol dehydrogenase